MLQDSQNIIHLEAINNNLTSLSGIQHLSRLTLIDVSDNQLSDASILTSLHNLRSITLNNNYISALPDMKSLTSLNELNIRGNDGFDCKTINDITFEATLITC